MGKSSQDGVIIKDSKSFINDTSGYSDIQLKDDTNRQDTSFKSEVQPFQQMVPAFPGISNKLTGGGGLNDTGPMHIKRGFSFTHENSTQSKSLKNASLNLNDGHSKEAQTE